MKLQSLFSLIALPIFLASSFFSPNAAAQEEFSDHPMLVRKPVRDLFETYWSYDEGDSLFKVFVMASDGVAYYYTRPTYEDALSGAMNRCASESSFSCRVFAVGNTIVWDMTDSELARAISDYRTQKRGPDSDLLGVPLTSDSLKAFETYKSIDDGLHEFKVFVLSEDEDAWSYWRALRYEEAERGAMEGCWKHTRRCRILAVGDVVVWSMGDDKRAAVVKAYQSEKQVLVSPAPDAPFGPSGIKGFNKYEVWNEGSAFKVFVLSTDGAWTYKMRSTLAEAIEAAMTACGGYTRRGTCQLFAVGNTVVWGMSKRDKEQAIAAYEAR